MSGAPADRFEQPPSRRRAVRVLLVVNYVNVAVAVIQGILLVPLYLSHLGSELYGSWLATGNILTWLGVVDPGVSTIIQQRVAAAAGARDRERLGQLLGGGLLLAVALFAAATVAGLAVIPLVSASVRLPAEQALELVRAFAAMAVVNGVILAYYMVTGGLIGLQLSVSIGLIYVGGSVAGIAATVVGLLGGWGLMAIVGGRAVTAAIWLVGNLAVLLFSVLPRWRLRLDVRLSNSYELLRLARFTFAAKVASTLAANLDAFLVNLFLGPGPVVVLSTTQKAIDVAGIATQRLGAAFMPALAHAAGGGEEELFRGVSLRLVRFVLGGLALVCGGVAALNGAFVGLWVGPALYGGATLTIGLVVAAAVGQVLVLLSNVLFARGEVQVTSVAALVEAGVRIAVLVMALALGARIGAAPLAALVASGTALAVVILPRAAALLGAGRLQRELAQLALPLLAIALLATLVALAPAPGGWRTFVLTAAAFAAGAVGLLLLVRPLRDELRSALRRRQ